jgi:ABC-type nitrate/sulfonate/bicarbonate transport system substrate-binding protein
MKRISAALAALLIAGAAQAEPLKIRADYVASPEKSVAILPATAAAAPGILRHYGKSYTLETTQMAGGGTILTALAANQTDLSGFTPQMLVLAKVQVNLDVKVIGQQLSDGVPGNARTFWWVRGAEIQKIEDLKGKTIAINARGANPDAALRMTMNKNGMADGKDYQIVEMRFPAMLPALLEKKVDAAILIPPFYLPAEKNPALKPLFAVDEVFGPNETISLAVRADYLAKNRAVLVDVLEDVMRFRRWITSPATRPAALKVVSDMTKQPVEALESWVYTAKDYFVAPDAMVNEARLQQNVVDMHRLGIAPATIDVKPHVDMSLAKEAASRLGGS